MVNNGEVVEGPKNIFRHGVLGCCGQPDAICCAILLDAYICPCFVFGSMWKKTSGGEECCNDFCYPCCGFFCGCMLGFFLINPCMLICLRSNYRTGSKYIILPIRYGPYHMNEIRSYLLSLNKCCDPNERAKDNLDGRLLTDCCASFFCPCCVLNQMHRQEAYKHKLEKLHELKLPFDAEIPSEESPKMDFIFEHTYCSRITMMIMLGLFKIFCCCLEC